MVVAWPSHYPHQCWNNVKWTNKNKLQGHFKQNAYISIQVNAFENVVCENGGHFIPASMYTICVDIHCLYQDSHDGNPLNFGYIQSVNSNGMTQPTELFAMKID